MFLPSNHEKLTKIESIDLIKLLFKGEVATCYEYRNRVVAFINQEVSEVEDKSTLDEDLEIVYRWFQINNLARFWQSTQKEKSAFEMADWILDNALAEVENNEIEEVFTKVAGVPSESDLDDVYNWVESSFTGSLKQTDWAKAIAHRHHIEIAIMWKKKKSIPTAARWWIDNHDSILVALGSL